MKTLVVQRAHYPRTVGSVGTAGEQSMSVIVGNVIAANPAAGWKVRLIDADEPTDRYRGDAFIAVHGDGSTSAKVGGASVGYRNAESGKMAQAFKAAYKANGWPFSFRDDNYTENLGRYYGTGKARDAGNPRAIIIEAGFLTNPAERAWINANAKAIAKSVWTAVLAGAPAVTPRAYDKAYYWIDADLNSAKKAAFLDFCELNHLKLIVRAGETGRTLVSINVGELKRGAVIAELTKHLATGVFTRKTRGGGTAAPDNTVRRLNTPTATTL